MAPSSPHSSVVRSASSLQRRFLLGAGLGGSILILLLAWGSDLALARYSQRQSHARLSSAAERASLVIDEALLDRSRQVGLLAIAPAIVAAAREGTARSAALGLAGQPVPVLEHQFAADRSLAVSPVARSFLVGALSGLDATDAVITDSRGLNAVTSGPQADFVQSDESWWQSASREGRVTAEVQYDSAAKRPLLMVAAPVRDGETRLGVVALSFPAATLASALDRAGSGVRIDIVDSTNRIMLSSDSAAIGRYLAGLAANADATGAVALAMAGPPESAVASRANQGRWRLVAHLSNAALTAPYRAARTTLMTAVGGLMVLLFAVLAAVHQFLARRISNPATELAIAAEAVAAGDFSVVIEHASADDEIGRLGRAVAAMILELRRLAQALAGSARETNAMSYEITAGSEEMAATAGEIANTASDLSAQATTMAETIASLATSATSLRELATTLDDGARGGSARNITLRMLAVENRAGLDASAASLGTLGEDVVASSKAIESLGTASEEIRSFVTLVRKLARQSKLLALNAAMEAARAGEHGEGFAVVASEVRRLAAMSSEAAERTEEIVTGVLTAIEESRVSAARAVATADEVRGATSRASESFTEIEAAVVEAEAWTGSVEQTSAETNTLVMEMTHRLESLAAGTESFAAAMEQVAASSEEQSASTQEIAAAANTLASAAERLSGLVANLRLGEEVATAAPVSPTSPPPPPARLHRGVPASRPALAHAS